MERLYQQYKNKAQFFVVYIREAHPSDGWVVPRNVQEGIEVKDPVSYPERADVAGRSCSILRINIPCLVDTMDDTVNRAYAAWPDRLYIIDMSGRIAVLGNQGPGGFAPSVYSAGNWLENFSAGTQQRSTRSRLP